MVLAFYVLLLQTSVSVGNCNLTDLVLLSISLVKPQQLISEEKISGHLPPPHLFPSPNIIWHNLFGLIFSPPIFFRTYIFRQNVFVKQFFLDFNYLERSLFPEQLLGQHFFLANLQKTSSSLLGVIYCLLNSSGTCSVFNH